MSLGVTTPFITPLMSISQLGSFDRVCFDMLKSIKFEDLVSKEWVRSLPLLALDSVYLGQGSTKRFIGIWISFLGSLFFAD